MMKGVVENGKQRYGEFWGGRTPKNRGENIQYSTLNVQRVLTAAFLESRALNVER